MSKAASEIGSQNVFNDSGAPNADEHMVKAQLVFAIDSIMKESRLTQGPGRRSFQHRPTTEQLTERKALYQAFTFCG